MAALPGNTLSFLMPNSGDIIENSSSRPGIKGGKKS
jgi:hypothetical protein